MLALAVLDLGFGRYSAALERLTSLPRQLRRHPTIAYLSPPEWAEAARAQWRTGTRGGNDGGLRAVGLAPRQPRRAGRLHRCRALLGPDDEAEAHYQAAIRLYDDLNRPMDRARSELLYGEWLRRVAPPVRIP